MLTASEYSTDHVFCNCILSISQPAIFGSPKGDIRNAPTIPNTPACVCPTISAINESMNRMLDRTDSTAAEQMQKNRHTLIIIPSVSRRGSNIILNIPRIVVSSILPVFIGSIPPAAPQVHFVDK